VMPQRANFTAAPACSHDRIPRARTTASRVLAHRTRVLAHRTRVLARTHPRCSRGLLEPGAIACRCSFIPTTCRRQLGLGQELELRPQRQSGERRSHADEPEQAALIRLPKLRPGRGLRRHTSSSSMRLARRPPRGADPASRHAGLLRPPHRTRTRIMVRQRTGTVRPSDAADAL